MYFYVSKRQSLIIVYINDCTLQFPGWRKFLAEEKASGNLVSGSGNRFKAARTLTQVLEDLKAQHTPRATGTPKYVDHS